MRPEKPEIGELVRALRRAGESASPRVAELALWAADQPQEIAFNSVRRLAERSGFNANTVVRLSQTLGFTGYDACRTAFQDALRRTPEMYSKRADALSGQDSTTVLDAIRQSGHRNLDSVFTDAAQAAVSAAAGRLLQARQVHVVGVRSCYGIADYLGYIARMAFDNFAPRASVPGDILDRIAETDARDVVLSITFRHYSVETIAAHDLARRRGAGTIAITDAQTAPTAQGADLVLLPAMHGPQPLPSMVGAFALAESIVAAMILRSGPAMGNITRFEQRMMEAGAYR